MPARRDGTPIYVDPIGAQPMLRVPFGEKGLNEGWLQDLFCEHPSILPIGEIDPSYGPITFIGKEVSTDCGPIDALFISPSGLLTIVEAKLWRNPEARRQVVGQILDYAKDVSRLSYNDLDRLAQQHRGMSLWNLANQEFQGVQLQEEQFVGSVCRGLQQGRFLFLIAGDGIREETERLIEFLQGQPNLHFTLALVELAVYKTPNDATIVLPVVVARTVEITRAIVRVDSGSQGKIEITTVGLPADGSAIARSSPVALTENEFFDQLSKSVQDSNDIEFARDMLRDFSLDPFGLAWRSQSVVIRLNSPYAPNKLFSIFSIGTDGSVAGPWPLPGQLAKFGVREDIVIQFSQDMAKTFGVPSHVGTMISWQNISLRQVRAQYPAFKAQVEQFAAQLDLLLRQATRLPDAEQLVTS